MFVLDPYLRDYGLQLTTEVQIQFTRTGKDFLKIIIKDRSQGGENLQSIFKFHGLDNANLISILWGFVNFYLETRAYKLEPYIFYFLT